MPAQPPARRSGRQRPQLDADTIVDAALRLAATGSATAVSVRKLGAELGADPTAIYRHFRDKDELMLALLDRLQGRAVEHADADADVDWRDALRHAALATFEVLSEHPAVGVYAGARTTGGPGERRAVEHTLAAFAQPGLSGEDAVRFYGVYSAFVLSFAASTAAALLIDQPRPKVEDDRWIGNLGRVDAGRFPHLAAHADDLARLTDQQVYLTGIEVILDAAEATVRGYPAGGSSGSGPRRSEA